MTFKTTQTSNINDSRINPRVPLHVSVMIGLPEGRTIQIPCENISLSGIMLAASQEKFEALWHGKNPEGINVQPELRTTFTLLLGDDKELIVNTQCRAIHVRRVSQDHYFIGLKFLQLNQEAASAIQQYIQNNLS